MNDNDEILAAIPAQIDLDDVEGHGLREVAVGLGAAAVLAGGAGGAMAASSSLNLPTVHPSGPAVMAPVIDPMDTVDRATDDAIGQAREARDSGLSTAGSAIDTAVTTAGTTVTTVTATAAGAQRTATALADRTLDSATRTVDRAKSTATTAANNATTTATTLANNAKAVATTAANGAVSAAGSAVSDASRTVQQTVRDTDRKVATVLSVVTTAAADGVKTATATLKAVNIGAGVDVENAGGWVLIKAGDEVLAQVQMANGSATVSWDAPLIGGHQVTVTYTGDDSFAPSTRALAL